MTGPHRIPVWPMIRLETTSEADALEVLQLLEARLGPLPQAELLEPWDDEDPWRLRVDVPALESADWETLVEARPDLTLEAGLLPGARAARDQDAVLLDVIEAQPGRAVLLSDAVEGGLCLPDLDVEDAEPASASVASELVAAVRSVSAELVPDTASAVDFVRHRTTGRRGIRVRIPSAPLERLSGDALLQVRRDVVAALGEVIARRPDALHPEMAWDARLGLSVVVWRLGERGAALPGDSVVEAGVWPRPHELAAVDLADRIHTLEIQVLQVEAGEHDAVVDAVVAWLQDQAWPEGAEPQGAEPRWVFARSGAGVVPAFVPTWHVPVQAREALVQHLAELGALPGVRGVRVVPVQPVGLEEVGPYLDPAWRWAGARWIVRWRDGVRDRDRLVAWIPREAASRDHGVMRSLAPALAGLPDGTIKPDLQGRLVRPIEDDAGRCGLALHGPSELAFDGMRLAWLLGRIGSIPLPGVADVVDLALPVDGVVLHLWYRNPPDGEASPPGWVSVG